MYLGRSFLLTYPLENLIQIGIGKKNDKLYKLFMISDNKFVFPHAHNILAKIQKSYTSKNTRDQGINFMPMHKR
jgi:hypothetical protein